MSLMEEIEKVIEEKKIPKWKILQNEADKEIRKMIDSGIPITQQIELLLKYKVVDKLDRKEYTGILVKHFGYSPKKRIEKSKKNNAKIKIDKQPIDKRSKTEKLSEDVDLMSAYLEKKTS